MVVDAQHRLRKTVWHDQLESLDQYGVLAVYPIRDGGWRALAQEHKANLAELEQSALVSGEGTP